MRIVPFWLSEDELKCRVTGNIYESDNRAELGEDMMEVALSNGLLICAGWYPEGDPEGIYVITVMRGMDHFIEPKEAKTAQEAVEILRDCVNAFWWQDVQTQSLTDPSPSEITEIGGGVAV